MRVINLFAGPGAGKSTTAAGLFYKMKRLSLSVELVTEYAKEKVYENALDIMADQLYLLAKQNRKLDRLQGKVDYVISDSPLLLCAYYGELYGKHKHITVPLSRQVFDLYDNTNILIKRTKVYDPRGRLGGFDNALKADIGIKELLKGDYVELEDSDTIIDEITKVLGL